MNWILEKKKKREMFLINFDLLFLGQRFAMMEEKVMVSAVLRRFNIQSLQTPDEVLPLSELILRPSGGIQVKLTPRS